MTRQDFKATESDRRFFARLDHDLTEMAVSARQRAITQRETYSLSNCPLGMFAKSDMDPAKYHDVVRARREDGGIAEFRFVRGTDNLWQRLG